MTVFVLTVLANIIFSLVLGLYTLKDGRFTFSFGVLVITVFATYKLDQKLKINDLPFETTIRYMLLYIWQYWLFKKQLYQDKRLNSNNKRYQIL